MHTDRISGPATSPKPEPLLLGLVGADDELEVGFLQERLQTRARGEMRQRDSLGIKQWPGIGCELGPKQGKGEGELSLMEDQRWEVECWGWGPACNAGRP